MAQSSTPQNVLKVTPLHALHSRLGGKLVPFAGYEMPLQYPLGILKEHLHTRAAAGLFDVSHMGQLELTGDDPARALENLVPGDIRELQDGMTRYTQLTSDDGGILDDLMVTRDGERLLLVVNAACKAADIAHINAALERGHELLELQNRALIALQGPQSAAILSGLTSAKIATLPFMSMTEDSVRGIPCRIWRSGYTGEDGFEISCAASDAVVLAQLLLAHDAVQPIGLGARDSLRLEAGLCLYGHDIDPSTTPVEADLLWSISKRRRKEGGFPGAAVVQRQINDGVKRLRIGIKPEGRALMREGVELFDAADTAIGAVTSGGFGPSVKGPVAMGYLQIGSAKTGTSIYAKVRGKILDASVVHMPFVEQRYYRD
ncbi:MAG: Aminomethyltransferase [Alphaproteobacteria bacterium MarineAlpha4_Bin2]|nr:MAG: Aminomethyltransferase [Alphaproteobacteria bacterium MarineAlpha4_Bin2]